MNLYLTENFIRRAKQKHRNMPFDYSKVSCTKYTDYVTITCLEHGDFSIIAYSFIRGRSCGKCKKQMPLKVLEKRLEDKGLKYLGGYQGIRSVIKVSCETHGNFEDFTENFLKRGCDICKYPTRYIDTFLTEAYRIHGREKYEYIELKEPIKRANKITVKCLACNSVFTPSVRNHLDLKTGCPPCAYKNRGKDGYT